MYWNVFRRSLLISERRDSTVHLCEAQQHLLRVRIDMDGSLVA